MARPSTTPRWATGGSAQITEPNEGKKDIGFQVAEKPAAQYFNWIFATIYAWITWLASFTPDLPITANGANEGAATAWAATTAYTLGQLRRNGGRAYQVITAGTSAGSGGPTTTAADITDGTVHWKYLGDAPTVSPSLDTTVDPGIIKLLWRISAGSLFGSPGAKVRLYVVPSVGLLFTMNAAWDATANNWVKDVAQLSYRVNLGLASVVISTDNAATTPFADAAFATRFTRTLSPTTLTGARKATLDVGPDTVAPMLLIFGCTSQPNNGVAAYLFQCGNASGPDSVEANTEIIMPCAGVLHDLRITGVISNFDTTTAVVRTGSFGGAMGDSSLTAGAAGVGSTVPYAGVDSTHSVAVAVGDRVSVKVTTPGDNMTSTSRIRVSFMFTSA